MRFAFILLLLLTLIALSNSQQSVCSGELSEEARGILEHHVYSMASASGYRLPGKCIFSQDRDAQRRLASLAERKRGTMGSSWRCKECDMPFLSRGSVDAHLWSRHDELLKLDDNEQANVGFDRADVCLADHCELLRCPTWLGMLSPAAMERGRCDETRQRTRWFECKSLAAQCFPSHESGAAFRLNSHFVQHFCDALLCGGAAQSSSSSMSSSSWWWWTWLLFIVIAVAIGLYYVRLYWRRQHSSSSTFRSSSSSSASGGGARQSAWSSFRRRETHRHYM
jgi:hypothetical protein